MPRPLNINEIRPIALYMLQHGPVKIFLTDLCINAECIIPGLPRMHCDSASFNTNTVEAIEYCFRLMEEGDARVKMITVNAGRHDFRLMCLKRSAILRTDLSGYMGVYRDMIRPIQDMAFHVEIEPA